MKKTLIIVLAVLQFSACGAPPDVVTQREQDAATSTTTARAAMKLTSPAETAPPTELLSETDDYEIYETSHIMYHVPSFWKPVNTDKDSAFYRKFKAPDFTFSVQVFDNYFNLADSTEALTAAYDGYFTKANASNLKLFDVNGISCIYVVLEEKNDPTDKTVKLACQSSDGVVYFNFFGNQNIDMLNEELEKFAKSISGNIEFPHEEITTTTKKKETKTTTEKPKTKTTTSKPTTTTEQTTTATADVGNWNAVRAANSYLSFMAFSRTGLIKQLEYEGYSHADAEYAADNCGADWTNQAAKKATEYLSTQAFSRTGLIKQLQYEGFSQDDAAYGADSAGADWNQQAAEKAQDYISLMSFSRDELIKQLQFEGFTAEQAAFGASAVGY